MIKGLKIAMIVWAVIGILYSLMFLFIPETLYPRLGLENAPASVPFFLAMLGNAYLVPSVFVILAARDPLKHILWVQLAIAWSILDLVAQLFYLIRGNINFGQAGPGMILDIVFVVAFLVLYPWRKASAG
jgi:hypothetical protein